MSLNSSVVAVVIAPPLKCESFKQFYEELQNVVDIWKIENNGFTTMKKISYVLLQQESVTINFADYTYGGNGALVFGNWESSYSFNMSRENGTSVTISVDNITDTFKVYNWYNLSDVISVTLNFV